MSYIDELSPVLQPDRIVEVTQSLLCAAKQYEYGMKRMLDRAPTGHSSHASAKEKARPRVTIEPSVLSTGDARSRGTINTWPPRERARERGNEKSAFRKGVRVHGLRGDPARKVVRMAPPAGGGAELMVEGQSTSAPRAADSLTGPLDDAKPRAGRALRSVHWATGATNSPVVGRALSSAPFVICFFTGDLERTGGRRVSWGGPPCVCSASFSWRFLGRSPTPRLWSAFIST